MRKLINFQQYQKNANKKNEPQIFYQTDYKAASNCKNPNSYGEICVQCGKCGRKFNKNGILK